MRPERENACVPCTVCTLKSSEWSKLLRSSTLRRTSQRDRGFWQIRTWLHNLKITFWHQALIEVQRILGTPVKFAEIETFWHSSFIQRRNTFYVVNAPYLVDVNYGIKLAKPGCSINWSNAALLLFIRQSPRLSSHVFLQNEITSQSAKWTLFFEQTSEPPSYFYAEQRFAEERGISGQKLCRAASVVCYIVGIVWAET